MPFAGGPLNPQKFFAPPEPFVVSSTVVIPAQQGLVLATFAPTVSLPRLMTPANAALTLTEFAATVSTPRLLTPASVGLVLSTFAPALHVSPVGTPSAAVLALTTFAPTFSGLASHAVFVTPDARPLILVGYSPDVQGDPHARAVGHVVSDVGRTRWYPYQDDTQDRYQKQLAIIVLFQSQAITEEEFVVLLAAAA